MQLETREQLSGKHFGSYQLDRYLGSTQANSVYQGHHRVTGESVMITMILMPETLSQEAHERFLARFHQEGSTLMRLRHPAIFPTYDVGVFSGFPYFITPQVQESSLSKALRQGSSLSLGRVHKILDQIASGLDGAHRNGVIHGALSPAHILLDEEQGAQVAGFGFTYLLRAEGIEQDFHTFSHLYTLTGALLGRPEYMSPELLQGQVFDRRADLYALSVIVFELLSGTLPCSGTHPSEIALQQLSQPAPSLSSLAPHLPAGLDGVMQKTLNHNPAERFQSAGEFSDAFEQALNHKETGAKKSLFSQEWMPQSFQSTSPLVANLADITNAATGKIPVTHRATAPDTGTMPSTLINSDIKSIDPFEWWLATSAQDQERGRAGQVMATGRLARKGTPRRKISTQTPRQKQELRVKKRRQVIAWLATGTVAAAGILGGGGLLLERKLHKQAATLASPTTDTTSAPASSPTITPATATSAPTQGTSTPAPQSSPTGQAQTPSPTPPPQHTGTVVGSTNQGSNTASNFTNPADGRRSLLINLGGNFVAYEVACTHDGVPVQYNPATQKLVCPRHGAIFDPANRGTVLQGPARRPLARVAIHINADGTITTG